MASDIHSQPLGAVNVVDTGVLHDIYTVPILEGPSVIKSFSIYAEAGAVVELGVFDGVIVHGIGSMSCPAGGTPVCQTWLASQPISPGWKIRCYNIGTNARWSVIVGGFHFPTP